MVKKISGSVPTPSVPSSIEAEAREILEAIQGVKPWKVHERCEQLQASIRALSPKDMLLTGQVNIARKKYDAGQLEKDEVIVILDEVLANLQKQFPGQVTLSKRADAQK